MKYFSVNSDMHAFIFNSLVEKYSFKTIHRNVIYSIKRDLDNPLNHSQTENVGNNEFQF